MTSKVPGSNPGLSGDFSLFRQFTSPTHPLNNNIIFRRLSIFAPALEVVEHSNVG